MGIYSMVAFFQKGGVFMYPILLVFVAEQYPERES